MALMHDKLASHFMQYQRKHNNKPLFNSKYHEDLEREYYQKLIEKGYGMKRSELKKKDLIDIRPLLSLNKDDTRGVPTLDRPIDELCFLKEHQWYSVIPCFTEGVIHLNTDRYIYYKMTDMNPYEQYYTVYLQDYIAYDSCWSVGVSGTTKIENPTKDEQAVPTTNGFYNILVTNTDITLIPDIYRILDYEKDLHWNKKQIDDWTNLIVKFADDTTQQLINRNTTQFNELVKIFLILISKINYALYTNKTKTPRKTTSATKHQTAIADTIEQPTKRIRTVGVINIKSEKPPRLPNKDTIVKYKVASWKTRGGVRRLKSGKLVPFKESIHHRHALMNHDTDTPQSVIKFKKKIERT